jgi:endonuclease/exonuclease/phosphatase family metal-dependent hydrolase
MAFARPVSVVSWSDPLPELTSMSKSWLLRRAVPQRGVAGRAVVAAAAAASALIMLVPSVACGWSDTSTAIEQHAPARLRLDGNLDEWDGIPPAATDPAGDSTGQFDLARVWVGNRGATVCLGLEFTEALNLQAGPSRDGTLVLNIETPDGSRIDFDFRARKGVRTAADGSTAPLTWLELGMHQAPTYASSTYELQLDLGAFGVEVGSAISVQFSGSDSLASPIAFRLSPGHAGEPERVGPASLARAAGTQLRIASYNTEHNGLRDDERPDRRDAIHRVVRAAAADVYCFQEEWTASADTLRRVMERIDPHNDGKAWSVVFDEGAAVASRYPILAMPDIPGQRAAGAIIKRTESPHDAILVYSVHFKCCGHMGSSEDEKRIAEANAIADQVDRLRRGQLGPAFADYADVPVVICGDYNLVGSRTPLTVLETRIGLRALDLLQMLSTKSFTWYDERSPYAPGRLDYITASPSAEPLKSMIVNARNFDNTVARELGLRHSDVAATDHLLMITDLRLHR